MASSEKVRLVLNVPPNVADYIKEKAAKHNISIKRALLGAKLDDEGRGRAWRRRKGRAA